MAYGDYDKGRAITVRSQKEFDDSVGNRRIPDDVEIIVRSDASIAISKPTNRKVILLGSTIALLFAPMDVAARETSRILAYNNSSVWIYDRATAILYDSAKVMSMDESSATLYDHTRSNAFDQSRVHLRDSSECCAFDSSSVSIRGHQNDQISVMLFSNKVKLFTQGSSNNTRVKNLTLSRSRGKTIQDFVYPNYR
jgi:hypothetical protein